MLFDEHSSSFSSPYLFNGKELDWGTNLSYYGVRYLDMKTSLWLSVDPLAEKIPNYGAYVYTFNNPIRFTDPTGMIAEPPIGMDAEDGAVHSDNSGKWIYEKATTI
ncbi:RHS repeat-associated core domain-containing protein [Flavobacterium sp. 28A]|uniref:RHS repeat domain-containing protein n=1 Tax=Flavobacterium sp. 28A TaxID=2735895 RepID=UPI00156E29B3